jgi:hypothetical protein
MVRPVTFLAFRIQIRSSVVWIRESGLPSGTQALHYCQLNPVQSVLLTKLVDPDPEIIILDPKRNILRNKLSLFSSKM